MPMNHGMTIAFFGSSLVSAYWNGVATYYRGIIRELYHRGHRTIFFEPDAFERQSHRDIDDPFWAEVVVYPPTEAGLAGAIARARRADVIIKASGVGIMDARMEELVLTLQTSSRRVVFWDVDAPATLERIGADPEDPFRRLISRYDCIFTYGGGPKVVTHYQLFGARRCILIYNALDPKTHFPVQAEPRFSAELSFLGNRLPDREARVEEFFLKPALGLPSRHFLLGGSGWKDKLLPPNMSYLGHVYTSEHNAFNCSAMAVLNVNRSSMVRYGHSPPTRIFEAAGAGACLISDLWDGIEHFLEPEREVLLASTGEEVAAHLERLDPLRAKAIGLAARRRILGEHTYHHRAALVEACLNGTSLRGAA
jgi:spore maturation protein CgeB